MGFRTGTGASEDQQTIHAVEEAFRQASAPLEGMPPLVGFLFAGPDQDLAAGLARLKALSPGCTFAGATTAGELTARGLTHHGVSLFLAASAEAMVSAAFAADLRIRGAKVADALCEGFADQAREASRRGLFRSVSVVLLDPLSGVGEELVNAIRDRTRSFQQIVGGAAGDEGRFARTAVGLDGVAREDAAVVVHLFSEAPFGIGIGHGLVPASRPMVVTRAAGNTVHEIDGQPAFEAYRAHARAHGVELSHDDAGPYLIQHELGVYFLEELRLARAPLKVHPDGSLTLAAPIAERSTVCILDGEVDAMVAASGQAAAAAREGIPGGAVAGALLFDCVCRGQLLGDAFQREIDGVRERIGGAPVAGFLTYGEVARGQGRLEAWHNTTAVVLAFPR